MGERRVVCRTTEYRGNFLVGKENSAIQIGCGKPLVDHIHDLILAGINIDEFFRVISQQGVAQQGEHCVRQGNADDHHDQEYNYIKEQQTAVLGGQGSGEQGNHHKTNDLSAAVFYCVKGAPLHAVRAVAGCDIWIASCQNSVLVTCYVGIAGFQTVRVVKAQSVFITDDDDIDIWYIRRKRIQVAGHGGIRIAVFQHGGDIRNCSNIRSGTADQLVHILSLPGNIKKQSKTK